MEALVTLDLPRSGKSRSDFNDNLRKNPDWLEITTLTTTWVVSFKEDVDKIEEAIIIIKIDIEKAKRASGVPKVNYAIQVGKKNVVLKNT